VAISPALWERLRKNLKDNRGLNEADTKGKLVEPVLGELDWDLLGEEVQRERGISLGSGTGHADYALKIDGTPRILIEVKPFGSELDDKRAKQALSYAAIEKVRWCVLTNGRKYRIYNSEWSSNPQDSLFRQFELDPDSPVPEELNLLSKQSVRSGKLDDLAQESKFALRLRVHLDSIMAGLRKETLMKARNLVFSRIKSEVPGTTREGVLKGVEPLLRVEVLSEPSTRISEAPPRVQSNKVVQAPVTSVSNYWLTPVRGDKIQSAEECVRSLVVENGIYAFGENTPGRKKIKAGDRICFYATGKGIIGHATVASSPEKMRHPAVRHPDKYEWVFRVADPVVYFDRPREMTPELRAQLDAFRGRDLARSWAWFVQSTSQQTEQDFKRLVCS